MHKPENVSFTILAFGVILICMFLWISHTFERKQTEEISDDIKKEIWRQIGLLEKVCKSTDDINQIFDTGKPQLSYLHFVGKPGIPIVTQVLLDKDKDWKLRCILAQHISKLETKQAIAPLEKILNDETDIKNIRVASAIALSNLDFDEVIEPLLKVAKGNDRELQLAAIYGLGELRKKEVVDELRKWIVNEKDLQIKKELELAIEKLSTKKVRKRSWLF
ncbi:MAG: HEAT repeat domain-containing protein [bacterium]